jgi:hypothetical protein
MLRASARAVVFTGAGISTESGIPDFRSPGGIWTKMAPIDFEDFVRSAEMRREAWRRRFAMEETFAAAKPNAGHLAIAELLARGKVSHVITQNIDNLHQDSGVPPEQVIELHGNTRYAKCLDCGTRIELAPIRAYFEARGDPPRVCGVRRPHQDRHHLLRPAHAGNGDGAGGSGHTRLRFVSGAGIVPRCVPRRRISRCCEAERGEARHPQSGTHRAGCVCRSGDPGRYRRNPQRRGTRVLNAMA